MDSLKQIGPLILEGDIGNQFKKWKQRFEIYMEATGTDSSETISAERKVAILLHTLGEETLDIYGTLEMPVEDKKDWKKVLEHLENHFIPASNETVNRHVFNTRNQKEGGVLRDSLIRDRIVCGIVDNKVRDRLLREADLNLVKCINICRAAELSETQAKQLKEEYSEIHSVKGRQNNHASKTFKEQHSNIKSTNQSNSSKSTLQTRRCNKCGFEHNYRNCPAFGKTCNICKQYNHFAKMCQNREMRRVAIANADEEKVHVEEEFIIEAITRKETSEEYRIRVVRKWSEEVEMDGKMVRCKIDTGAEVNILNRKTAVEVGAKIVKSGVKLSNYNGTPIEVYGKTTVECKMLNKSRPVDFMVINFDAPCIIGLPFIEELEVLKKIQMVDDNNLENLLEEKKNLFIGVGKVKSEYSIKLKKYSVPVIEASRKIPMRIEEEVKAELERMENSGIIRKVVEPTEWVNSMVVVRKPDNSLRICIDPSNLNKAIVRERFHLPTFEDISFRMPEAKLFCTLDANKGFYHIKLHSDSQLLTTFNAGKFGRYCYQRLPYGLCSAPEVFQRTFGDIFGGLEGVQVYIDDIIIWAVDERQMKQRLELVLKKAECEGVKFNKKKCKFMVREVKYLGHVFSGEGLKPDPDKIKAVLEMEPPKNKKDLQTVLGIATYVSKFLPNLSDLTKNLRLLLKQDSEFVWNENHDTDFEILKNMLTNTPVLKYYNVNKPVVLSVDSSSTGLGAVMLQENLPVAYASKSLSNSQKLWAQIEKELLAICFGCEKFHQFIFGKTVTVESDHKPLEQIFKKPLSETPLRLQRLRLRLQPYDINIKYVPGKQLLVADALSRNCTRIKTTDCLNDIDADVDFHVCFIIDNLPISKPKREMFVKETEKDQVLQTVIRFMQNGWPRKELVPPEVYFYYSIKDELSYVKGLVFKNTCVVVPTIMRKDMLKLIHCNHLGIDKCKARARQALFWPHMSKEIEDIIKNCETCLKFKKNICMKTCY